MTRILRGGTRSLMTSIGAAVVLVSLGASPAIAVQGGSGPDDDLRVQVTSRFNVLLVQKGVVLVPKSARTGVRSIELTDGTIAIDGREVTGGEVRSRMGADADVVLRLSYLDPAARRTLLEPPASPAASPTPTPQPPPPPSAESQEPDRADRAERARARLRSHRGGARMRVGGSVTVAADETTDDVVVVGGTVDIEGRVLGDVVVIGGALTLGPKADISGDVTIIGGMVNRDPGAQIAGKMNEVGAGAFDLRGMRLPRLAFSPFFRHGGAGQALSLLVLFSTLTRFVVLSVLASLIVLFAHEHVERIGARAAADPIKAGLVGFLGQLLMLPLLVVTIILLVVTIIGIPLLALLPFAILAVCVVFLLGFTAVAYYVGRAVATKFGWTLSNRYATAIVGILTVMSPIMLARLLGLGDGVLFPLATLFLMLGLLIEYAAWTVGFGAVALARFEKTRTT